jgi:sugar lactone lactonase YvrE
MSITKSVTLICALLVVQSAKADFLYVSLGSNRVVKYNVSLANGADVQSSAQTFASTNLSNPHGLAFDSTGNLFVANPGSNTISKFNTSGVFVSSISNSNLSGSNGLAIDLQDNLYVSNNTNVLTKFDANGNHLANISGNLDNPSGVAIDSSGNIFVANYGSNGNGTSVSKFNSSGNFVASVNTFVKGPWGLAIDDSGNLFVANNSSENPGVLKFNNQGDYLSVIGGGQLSGIAFDSQGNLYAASYQSGAISKFSSDGVFQFSWSTQSEGGTPRYLAVSAVPEPSAGFVGLVLTTLFSIGSRKKRAIQSTQKTFSAQ